MAGYIGTTPVPQATQHRESFTATGGQTSFATVGYTPQFIDVYLNGVKLAPADYTATNGSDVVLASGATASDILEIVAYTPFEVANQTFTGDTSVTNLAVTGTFTSRGIDDNADAVAITIDSSENVGIGTSSPTAALHIASSGGTVSLVEAASGYNARVRIQSGNANESFLEFADTDDSDVGEIVYSHANNSMRFNTNAAERMRIDSSGNVGIGTSSPFNVNGKNLHVQASSSNARAILESSGGSGRNWAMQSATDGSLNFYDLTGSSEAMRIDSSGRLLLGTPTFSSANNGILGHNDGRFYATATSQAPLNLNLKTSDGDIAVFSKDGAPVGSIGTRSDAIYIGRGDTGISFTDNDDAVYPVSTSGLVTRDAAIDLGIDTVRFKDLYLSGGVYLGGTGSANKLDDYEYGDYAVTFTPSGGGSITVSGSQNDLKYTKIGSRVFISGKVDISAASSPSGYIAVTLPFAIHNSGTANDSRRFCGSMWVSGAAIETYKFQIYGIEGESAFRIYNGSGTGLDSTSANQFSGDESVAFNFHYETTP